MRQEPRAQRTHAERTSALNERTQAERSPALNGRTQAERSPALNQRTQAERSPALKQQAQAERSPALNQRSEQVSARPDTARTDAERAKLEKNRALVRRFAEDAAHTEDNRGDPTPPPSVQSVQDTPPAPQESALPAESEEPYRRVTSSGPVDQGSTFQAYDLFEPEPEEKSPPPAPQQEDVTEEPAHHRHRHSGSREQDRTLPDEAVPGEGALEGTGKLQFRTSERGTPQPEAADSFLTHDTKILFIPSQQIGSGPAKAPVHQARDVSGPKATPKSHQKAARNQLRAQSSSVKSETEQKLQFKEAEQAESSVAANDSPVRQEKAVIPVEPERPLNAVEPGRDGKAQTAIRKDRQKAVQKQNQAVVSDPKAGHKLQFKASEQTGAASETHLSTMETAAIPLVSAVEAPSTDLPGQNAPPPAPMPESRQKTILKRDQAKGGKNGTGQKLQFKASEQAMPSVGASLSSGEELKELLATSTESAASTAMPIQSAAAPQPIPESRQKAAQKQVKASEDKHGQALHFKESEQSAPQADMPASPPAQEQRGQIPPRKAEQSPLPDAPVVDDRTRPPFKADGNSSARLPEQSSDAAAEKSLVKDQSARQTIRQDTGRNLRFEAEDSGKPSVAEPPKKSAPGKGGKKLQFTEVESPKSPASGKATAHSAKAAQGKAKGKVTVEPSKGQSKRGGKLQFDDAGRRSRPSRLTHEIAAAPMRGVAALFHQEISNDEKDNVGVESTHKLEEAAEGSARLANRSLRSQRVRQKSQQEQSAFSNQKLRHRKKAAEAQTELAKTTAHERQKKHLKKQYAKLWRSEKKAGRVRSAAKDAEKAVKKGKKASQAVKKGAEETAAAAKFVWNHKAGVAIVLGLALAVVFLLNCFSSCSVMLEGGVSVLGSSTFPSSDADILGAEAAYAGKEADLQSYLDNYESTHDYDEYHYELDEISHDPYVLISLLSALHPGSWTLADVGDTLQSLFDQQYILTETVTTETRYDEDDEPYTYYICTVKLENTDLSHLTATALDEDGRHLYATYMATHGNRPDLFPVSEYPNASSQQDYLHYDVPPEALEDETFAAMLQEAEKYLGFPYVWGGASPATSFDCSGYVSWVINHSGWNVGRLTAQGLFNICTPVTAANARPGDLVLFKGTYNTTEVSHVGIYVGNNMMIHCGNPISYANLSENYWQQHLYCYGRLP